ncbi:MAG: hypothetical protein GC200_11060 [Tepidisphaera sp.]|nr:hypothetical protein [Tepidisphaera sp.]
MILLAVILIAISLPLLIFAARGRRLSIPPACRKCGFEVASIIAAGMAGKRCPECGADLAAARAVRTSTRRRRPVLIAAASLFLLASLSPIYLQFHAARVWAWGLAHSSTSMLAFAIEHAQGGVFIAAVDEASSRVAAVKPAPGELGKLARAALVRQKGVAPWDRRLGSIIERAYDAGEITHDEGVAYVLDSLDVTLSPKDPVIPGSAVVGIRLTTARAGPSGQGAASGLYTSQELRDQRMDLRVDSADFDGVRRFPFAPSDPRSKWPRCLPESVGSLLTSDWTEVSQSFDAPTLDGKVDAAINVSLVMANQTRSFHAAFKVPLISKSPDVVEPVSDEETAAKLRAACLVAAWKSPPQPDGRVPVNVSFEYFPAKVPIRICAKVEVPGSVDRQNFHTNWYPFPIDHQNYSPESRMSAFQEVFYMPAGWNEPSIDVELVGVRKELEMFGRDVAECARSGSKLPLWMGPLRFEHVTLR